MYRHKKSVQNAIKIFGLLTGLVISAYFVGIIDEDIISRFKTLSSDNPEVATSHRSDIWKTGLTIIIDSFPLGVGFKNFEIAYELYVNTMNVGYRNSKDPHNAFIAVLAETGLVGFAIFVGIFVYLFKDVRRIMNPIERSTYMWLLAYLVLVSSTLSFHYTSWFWSALIFITLAAKLDKQSPVSIRNRPLYSS
jgi:O-antigen ligase